MIGDRFQNRIEAGRVLADELSHYAETHDVLVLGLPRGGVPLAFEVSEALGAELDIFLVRKLGVPGQEELAMGAIASGGVRVMNAEVMQMVRVSDEEMERVTAREKQELRRRERAYRGDRPAPELQGRAVILVDDGLATGSTMRAAARAARLQNVGRLVVAVPVAARETCESFRDEVDELVCARTPDPFRAVGLWYEDFSQTSDGEVTELLARAREAANTRR